MLYQTDAQFAARTDPARRDAVGQAFMNYVRALQDARVLVTTLGIEPPETAATVRRGNGVPRQQKGPFTNTKEQLGGLCVDRGTGPRLGDRAGRSVRHSSTAPWWK